MIHFLKQLILEAGAICINEQAQVHENELVYKTEKDLVTVVDKKVEKFIVNTVQKQFPDHGFYGEETGQTNIDADYLWIIDPIDGTTNFVESGLLDSFAILSMIMDLESRFSVKFQPRELADPGLRRPSILQRLIWRHRFREAEGTLEAATFA